MATPAIKCPRCTHAITGEPDAQGILVCPGCSARLRAKAPAPKAAKQQLPAAEGESPADMDSLLARLDATPAPPAAPPEEAEAPVAPPRRNPSATLPPGTPLKPLHDASHGAEASLELARQQLEEIRMVRRLQEETLALLRSRPASALSPPASLREDDAFEERPAAPPQGVPRSRRRKTLLLIDDDEETAQAALEACQKAQIPTRLVNDGNLSLAAIAEEKPDVIAMELAVGGVMAGKDVINMIKATMEWVDIPIILYTRLPIESQKEARTIHGADEFVPKQQGPDALVTKVIMIFRKG